jgi:hypothetical protein
MSEMQPPSNPPFQQQNAEKYAQLNVLTYGLKYVRSNLFIGAEGEDL